MRHLLFLIASFLLLNCIGGNTRTANSQEDDPIISVLKEFYTEYIALNLVDVIDDTAVLELKEKYLSTCLLKKLSSQELNFDPIVDAQDYREEWVAVIEVTSIDSLNNLYAITLPDNMSNNKDRIIVKVIHAKDGRYLIDDIVYDRENRTNGRSFQQSPVNGCHGTWVLSEKQQHPYIAIRADLSAYIVVESDQIMINAKLIPDKDSVNNSYNILLVTPAEELGVGGQRLDWSNFSKTLPVANIEFESNNKANFTWYGFYNTINKERVWQESQFTREVGTNKISLKKL